MAIHPQGRLLPMWSDGAPLTVTVTPSLAQGRPRSLSRPLVQMQMSEGDESDSDTP